MTHKTLPLNYADCAFKSMSLQAMRDDKQFDELWLYNTWPNELTNESLIELYEQYDLKRFFKNGVHVFPYDNNTPKTVPGDVGAVCAFARERFAPEDRIFMYKSDCILSKNFFDEFLHIPEGKLIYFSTPFINGKARVTDEELLEYASREEFIQSDDITFFVEDMEQHMPNDFTRRPGTHPMDAQFKFTSCYGIRDGFSSHGVSVGLSHKINLFPQASWGGIRWDALIPNFVGTNRCFLVHKYHGIKSENRATDREGPAEAWLNS